MPVEPVRVACEAMATRFEVILHGENAVALRAAAEEAFREIQRLHAQLSLYLPSSEISSINARAAHHEVQVEPRLFQLLQLAQRIHRETQGAFDITIGPLLRCWGFLGDSGSMPSPEQITEARARVGMDKVFLDERHFTVRFAREGMMIDLGSIGKGYALEVAAEVLAEAGVTSALIHGGTSTICALGAPPDAGSWKVAIDYPPGTKTHPPTEQSEAGRRPLAVVPLKDEALSVSGVHGKSFTTGGRTYGHIIDPRTGHPAQSALIAAVALPSATETDAFSTALLLGGAGAEDALGNLRPGMRTLVYDEAGGQARVSWKGIAPLSAATG